MQVSDQVYSQQDPIRKYFSRQLARERAFQKHYLSQAFRQSSKNPSNTQGPPKMRQPVDLLILATLFLLLLVFTALAVAETEHNERNSNQTQIQRINEVQTGQLLIKDLSSNSFASSVLLASDAKFTITGLMAHVSIKQKFINSTDDFVEAIYVFPLPETAAVNRLVMNIGSRRIEGRIKEKTEAKRIYTTARSQGKKAGLMSQQRPNMFTTAIANIAPGETVDIELAYVQRVEYKDATFSLRFPMTITPRYNPGQQPGETFSISPDVTWGQPTDQVPDANEITPSLASNGATKPTISLAGTINMGMAVANINSAYHPIDVSRDKHQYHFAFKQPQLMQQDFEISWRALVGSEPKVALFTEEQNGEHYALLMMLAPEQMRTGADKSPAASINVLSREMIYIIDTSGSMGGVSIKQAKASLNCALSQLTAQDKFNIVEFNSTTRPLHRHAVSASAENIRRARAHVASLRADGGTEMYDALSFAFKVDKPLFSGMQTEENEPPDSRKRLRQIIFITDGAVGNEEALFKLIHDRLGDSRLFTIGIGSAPNSYFMRKAAEFGRGTHTHIGSVNEVQTKMDLLLKKLERPLARDIEVHWPDNFKVESYPERVPDLFPGEPLFLAVKLRTQTHTPKTSQLEGTIRITGITASAPWSRKLRVKNTPASGGLATLWARRKIASLEDDQVMGAEPASIKNAITRVALNHQLVSKYTSFVAVEEIVSRPEESLLQKHSVPNAAPRGQAAQTFAYPRTATSAGDHLYYGGLLLILAFMVSLMNPEIIRRLRYGENADAYLLVEE